MLAINHLTPEFVESAPSSLEAGKLYISIRFKTALHSCCCGCGREVVTPFSPAKWTLLFHGASVSLFPSVGNWATCRSHYVIQENRVIQGRQFEDWEICANQAQDEQASEGYFKDQGAAASERLWKRLFED